MSRFIFFGASILLSAMSAGMAGAQTRFEWPSRQVDVGTYTLLDQCLGAAGRVRDSINGVGVLKDTLPLAQRGPFHVLDQAIVAVAQRCIASIPLSSVTTPNTLLAQDVLLIANRDTDVISLYRKRLDAASTDSLKIDAIASTVQLLVKAVPARLRLADSLLADIQPYDKQWITADKLDIFGKLCRLSDVAHNNALVTKYCGGFLSMVDNMTDAEYGRYGPVLGVTVAGITRYIKRSEMQDSLAKSSQAYVSLARAILIKAFRGWGGNSDLGANAEPIVGDFWFPESAQGTSYPRPGKVTLLVSVAMTAFVGKDQLVSLTKLKRLAARFPDLDIVAITGTTGHFGVLAPPVPAIEAKLNYQRIANFYKVPLVMAVTTSPTWRLADPDRRRIYDPYPHSEAYTKLYHYILGGESSRAGGWVGITDGSIGFLVDADGVIVDYLQEEDELTTQIDILMKRTKQ